MCGQNPQYRRGYDDSHCEPQTSSLCSGKWHCRRRREGIRPHSHPVIAYGTCEACGVTRAHRDLTKWSVYLILVLNSVDEYHDEHSNDVHLVPVDIVLVVPAAVMTPGRLNRRRVLWYRLIGIIRGNKFK
ncbi:protein phosphatase 2 (formerly 2A), catalytic subunit [Trypanosoma cruzi]|nr:protein phosphatase 2 (formerly 2A), catalytic subunit [Trypanosoma cruzi]